MSAGRARIGVALFGAGRAGSIHFLNLVRNNRVEILHIVETDVGLSRAKDLVASYNLTTTTVVESNIAETVFNNDKVTAVIVCAPTFEHEKIVLAALRHGKAVFCEKPISQEEGGTKMCYEESERVGKPLFCSFNRRFDPSFRGMNQRARNGEIGTIHVVKTCSRDSPLPSTAYLKISGGIFHDCAVHDIDVVCWMIGERPNVVYALAHAHMKDINDLGDVDTVVITMKFPSGALATIDLSRHSAYGYDQRAEVFGTKGMMVSENQRPTELTSLLSTGTHRDVIKYSFPQRYAEAYASSMEHFLNVVEGKETMEISKTDVVNVTDIAFACEESYKTGKPVVPNYSC